jgi:hypothetical protein
MYSKYLIHGRQIYGKTIQSVVTTDLDAMTVLVEFCELIYVFPYSVTVGMKDMSSINMLVCARFFTEFGVDIAAYMIAFFYHGTGVSRLNKLFGTY